MKLSQLLQIFWQLDYKVIVSQSCQPLHHLNYFYLGLSHNNHHILIADNRILVLLQINALILKAKKLHFSWFALLLQYSFRQQKSYITLTPKMIKPIFENLILIQMPKRKMNSCLLTIYTLLTWRNHVVPVVVGLKYLLNSCHHARQLCILSISQLSIELIELYYGSGAGSKIYLA